ncbi:PREDICTED: uncharacterized protein LOC105107436 [Populus euphratica]|uniref:Uncharacterized protein LOC105107436 n=1 Tax=Populus euphratica TaxID=75702 RepID=A0AAJ6SVB3_POPEU|nr:PREDICTED: uncharacterized protein LOC105107436 [Populus euphratica]
MVLIPEEESCAEEEEEEEGQEINVLLFCKLLRSHNSSKAYFQESDITLPLPFSEKLEEPETEHLQQPENPACCNHSAELFQQLQILLLRFIETEPLEQEFMLVQGMPCVNCSRFPTQKVWIERYRRNVIRLCGLAPDLLRIFESSILNSHLFLKMDKKKQYNARYLFGN